MSYPEIYTLTGKVEKEPGVVEFQVVLNANHSVFEGHFPGQPVMPGVMSLSVISNLLGSHCSKSLFLRSAREVKFLGMIIPDQVGEMTIEIRYQLTETGYDVKASIYDKQHIYLKMSGLFIALT